MCPEHPTARTFLEWSCQFTSLILTVPTLTRPNRWPSLHWPSLRLKMDFQRDSAFVELGTHRVASQEYTGSYSEAEEQSPGSQTPFFG
jgi:hypothetical protein